MLKHYYVEKYSKWKLHPSHQPPYSPNWSEKSDNAKEKEINDLDHNKHTAAQEHKIKQVLSLKQPILTNILQILVLEKKTYPLLTISIYLQCKIWHFEKSVYYLA